MPSAPLVLTRVDRALRHAASRAPVRFAYFSLVALFAMWPVLGRANELSAFGDAQHFTLLEEVARLSVVKFHELPLWDPYYCGGIAGLGTPSARFAAPTFLFTLLFGTLRGEALTATFLVFVGLEGTFRYVRARGGGAAPAMLVAPAFALSGLFPHATLVAWTNFFGFELVPWALYGIGLALRGSRRGVVLAALMVGWMIGFGGTYTAPLTLIAAVFEVVAFAAQNVRRPRRLAPIVPLGLSIALLAAALGMARLWPVAETLSASPRILGGTPGQSFVAVQKALFGDPAHAFARGDFLIGLPLVPVLLVGLWRRSSVALGLGALLSFWLALGYDPRLSLFAVLRTVPPYTMLRSPGLFLVFFALAAAALAARGVRRLEVRGRRRTGYLVAVLACHSLLVGDTVLLALNEHGRAAARHLDPAPTTVSRDFRQTRGNRWLSGNFPFMSRGSLTCFEEYDIVQSSALRGDLAQEEYLRDEGAGTVKRVHWSPNRIDLQVALTRPARVYVNQNWHPGWRANVGSVVAEDGLLAVDLPAGTHDLTLRFWPRSAVAGICTTLVALVAIGFLARRSLQRDLVAPGGERWTTLALAGAPLLVVPISLALMREPRRPPPPLLTASGEAMVVDAPPEDTTRLDAHLESGIVLEAAHVEVLPAEDERGPVAIVELDWRFDQSVPPGLGVFIQLEQGKHHFGTDHVLLSGVLLPESAPLGKTVRDISEPIAIPVPNSAVTWSVYVGFWRARRDMSRLRVVEMGDAKLSKGRVLAGTFDLSP